MSGSGATLAAPTSPAVDKPSDKQMENLRWGVRKDAEEARPENHRSFVQNSREGVDCVVPRTTGHGGVLG